METWFVIIPVILLLASFITRFIIRIRENGFWEISNFGRTLFLESTAIMGVAWLNCTIECEKSEKLRQIISNLEIPSTQDLSGLILPSIQIDEKLILLFGVITLILFFIQCLGEFLVENYKDTLKFKNIDEDYTLSYCIYVSVFLGLSIASLTIAFFIYSHEGSSFFHELKRFYFYRGLIFHLIALALLLGGYGLVIAIKGTSQSRGWREKPAIEPPSMNTP